MKKQILLLTLMFLLVMSLASANCLWNDTFSETGSFQAGWHRVYELADCTISPFNKTGDTYSMTCDARDSWFYNFSNNIGHAQTGIFYVEFDLYTTSGNDIDDLFIFSDGTGSAQTRGFQARFWEGSCPDDICSYSGSAYERVHNITAINTWQHFKFEIDIPNTNTRAHNGTTWGNWVDFRDDVTEMTRLGLDGQSGEAGTLPLYITNITVWNGTSNTCRAVADTTPPVISNLYDVTGAGTNKTSDTTPTINLTTDEACTCNISTDNSTWFGFTTTGGTNHQGTIDATDPLEIGYPQ
ncbi:MAG: hypothetical protein KAK00_11135, partial [Nanoarchaeota archaeon]|nr:hypothetical protein [Nanoarchaeota archaeon]